MNINYQLKMEEMISKIPSEKIPTLLLHSCCAPCSSAVLEKLSQFFEIAIFYYNPNIYPKEEFKARFKEQKKLLTKMKFKHPVHLIEGTYDSDIFEKAIKDYRHLKEGSNRCFACYLLRLEETVKWAQKENFDYFTTTLSVSPYKNAKKLNEIGKELEEKYKIKYLYADFKKKDGYKRSIELSKQYGLYRQNYCGCVYSQKETLERRKELYV